jgi:hypothetical protein
MAITLKYQPDKGISIGDKLLFWNADRQQVRALLNDEFKVDDDVIDLSKYNDGDTSKKIIQRRDIYENYQGQDNFFFLNFDVHERLTEVEVHHGLDIDIESIVINNTMDIENIANLLDNISGDKKQLSDGEYFYKSLKLTIASSDAMGGDGKELGYFYCSKDVSHLVDD